ncbi:guanylate-binding protein 1-like [Rhineura floridana]|uniref:guanylate-binding protein 1-like n=1 Tax=Rhineura floridana TaxID=261503 RepID=UPI002AC84DB5|nr:guanylate-binding protein 1-like [Rhineura floridana]XP_061452445.1 guanylate-binding protein 1-like [Rhineura floridana]XP_061452446.1 guanylate-binding protein 1-like [Rhineura floridana]XP_061452447.1 guanylate-binding protein 1-like [Rhineura floridana]XP_061452448.1 guanylate-binding protein 1-like [Rhineura floridana]XP_061452449.1 guanylate-binding protein 1-like [Rhineura floridana]
MSLSVHMPAPICLIENRGKKFIVCEEALQVLSKIHQPVVVVAIVGCYRTGKSYLMNKLAGKSSGFLLGSTVQSMTKGIWMWCVPYPDRPGQTLVLLDTEGLGDVEKGDPQNDTWIFALAVLLSSTLVYNSLGAIDQQAMDQLHYVTELTEHIKTKSSRGNNNGGLENSAEFVRFFPTFIWALRDFTLQLEMDGHSITEDQYLENALRLKKGDSHDVQLFNMPRKCIRFFFPTRKCFIFDQPTNRKNLHHLESMQESELDPEFVQQATQFCRYVYWTSKEKTIPGGHTVTGCLLASLAKAYVDTIHRGEVPCMENVVLNLAKAENQAALDDATARYVELMEQKVKLPTEIVQELLGIHAECEKEALQVFMARAFKDDDRKFQVELMKTLDQKKEEYCRKNEQQSSKLCWAALKSVSGELEDNIKKGIYSQPGGHKQFVDDLKKMEQRYHQEPNKGIMAEAVLQQFVMEKENVSRAILQSDKALSEKEKEMAEAKAKAEALQREQEIQKQKRVELEQKVEDQRRSYEMNLQQLKEKIEREREDLLAEQQKMMDSKLMEQEALLKDGFQKEANRMNGEIQQLKQQSENVSSPPWYSNILNGLADAVTAALPGFISRGVDALICRLTRSL